MTSLEVDVKRLRRRVRTPGGAALYDRPIGAYITPAEEALRRASRDVDTLLHTRPLSGHSRHVPGGPVLLGPADPLRPAMPDEPHNPLPVLLMRHARALADAPGVAHPVLLSKRGRQRLATDRRGRWVGAGEPGQTTLADRRNPDGTLDSVARAVSTKPEDLRPGDVLATARGFELVQGVEAVETRDGNEYFVGFRLHTADGARILYSAETLPRVEALRPQHETIRTDLLAGVKRVDIKLELKYLEPAPTRGDVRALVDGEVKVRRVRSAEGARLYGQPIGSVIKPGDKPGGGKRPPKLKPDPTPGAGRGVEPEAARRRAERAQRAVDADRAGDASSDAAIRDRAELAKINKRRRAQGKPPLLKLPEKPKPDDSTPAGAGRARIAEELSERARSAARARRTPDASGPASGPAPVAPDASGPDPRSVPPKAAAAGTLDTKGDGSVPMPAGKYDEGDPRNDPEYEAYLRDVDAKTKAALKAGRSTHQLFGVQDGVDKKGEPVYRYTAERQRWHDEVLDEMMAGYEARVPRERKAIMMGGLPGSGKSTFLKNHGEKLGLEIDENGDPTDAIVINPDVMKAVLLERTWRDGEQATPRVAGLSDGEHASIVHEESSDLAKALAQRALAGGFNVVFDITLGSATKATDKYLTNTRGTGSQDLGYTVAAAFVDGDMKTSLHRAGLRHKQPDRKTGKRRMGGRYVSYEHIRSERNKDGTLASDGTVAKSQNRVEYDALVKGGQFDYAIRYDNVTGEFHTDIEDQRESAPGLAYLEELDTLELAQLLEVERDPRVRSRIKRYMLTGSTSESGIDASTGGAQSGPRPAYDFLEDLNTIELNQMLKVADNPALRAAVRQALGRS